MKTLNIRASTPYPIYIGQQLLTQALLADHIKTLQKRVVLIADNQVAQLLAPAVLAYFNTHSIDTELLTFPAGEQHKTRETKAALEDSLCAKHYGRDTCLIALGGGVTTDLVGFIAATYMRGIPVIYIPTTLLAMVDASIGGKTGINTSFGKNLIGSFTQPHAVFIDTHSLAGLSKREYINGLAEVIKHALIADAKQVTLLETQHDAILAREPALLAELILQNCRVKQRIVEQDEQERGIRQHLNYGHTIGHAIELIEAYRIGHGEAVAIGMLVEAYIAVRLGILAEHALTRLQKLMQLYELPLTTQAFANPALFIQTLTLDKKAKAKIPHFVLLKSLGEAYASKKDYTVAVSDNVLQEAIAWAAKHYTHKTISY